MTMTHAAPNGKRYEIRKVRVTIGFGIAGAYAYDVVALNGRVMFQARDGGSDDAALDKACTWIARRIK